MLSNLVEFLALQEPFPSLLIFDIISSLFDFDHIGLEDFESFLEFLIFNEVRIVSSLDFELFETLRVIEAKVYYLLILDVVRVVQQFLDNLDLLNQFDIEIVSPNQS